MYLSHFGLTQPPFSITPNPEFFYAGNQRGAILDALVYAVTHGEGIVKVTGEVGSGKTMLCRMLVNLLPQKIKVIYLVNPSLNRAEVIYAIAGELDLSVEGKRTDEVIRLLQNALIKIHAEDRQVVLLVEEAQAMPLDTLEEIRLFSNLETAHHKLLQIVLFGQPELDENLSLAHMRPLKERITHSFKVPRLEAKFLPEYLMLRMRAAGYRGPDIFTKRAIKRIAKVSDGIVRRINILADKSLLAAFAENTHAILHRHARAAIHDCEFSRATSHWQRRRMADFGFALSLVACFVATWYALAERTIDVIPAQMLSASPSETVATPLQEPHPALPTPIISADSSIRQPPDSTSTSNSLITSTLGERLAATQNWLNSESQDNYTIQLLLAPTEDPAKLERFLKKMQVSTGLSSLYVYPARMGSTTQLAIAAGNYTSREEAQSALTRLSETSRWNIRPYLRTLKGVREEIESQIAGVRATK